MGKIHFEPAFSILHLVKFSRVETLLHKLKCKIQPEKGVFLGELYGKRLKRVIEHIDIIIPIPIHINKLRKRGYNQAAQFAFGLSLGLDILLDENILKRDVLSISYTQKSRTERYNNVKGVFSVSITRNLQEKHILLVDDVLTTGASICEAAQLLIYKGTKVSIATIGRE
ncbi:ComF family protein [Sphingobacterium sp. SGL-16]|uniref:ComF family protein n=1 Tax=Sphingobacterium sp. SGL-16 TaxID=2710883 RepID=UPI0019D09995|nr:phosphoribosyltransferase family protein [Sphingobacterium sp. SGL-16]